MVLTKSQFMLFKTVSDPIMGLCCMDFLVTLFYTGKWIHLEIGNQDGVVQ